MNAWLEAARPKTLTAAVSPVLVGTAAAEVFVGWRLVAALVVALFLQIAVNLSNDLSDAQRGIDTAERTGPRRAVAAGLISPGSMKLGIATVLLGAGVVGALLATAVGPELYLVGIASGLAALLYSGGPAPYASKGLGEIFVFLFFGVVATVGSAYVQDETITQLAYVASIPVGLLAVAILVVNNLRDIATDAAAGKKTLSVRIGAERSKRLFQALVITALLYTGIVAAVDNSFFPLLALAAAPLAIRPVSLVMHATEPAQLIAALTGTARLQLAYSALLAAGLWVS